MDVGRLAVVIQTSISTVGRLSSYLPSPRNVAGPIGRFRTQLYLGPARVCSYAGPIGRFSNAAVDQRTFAVSSERAFAVFSQTRVCRFRPNTSLPFSAKHEFDVFG